MGNKQQNTIKKYESEDWDDNYASDKLRENYDFDLIINMFDKKNKVSEELQRFENKLPCLLKSNSDGDITAFNSCLEEIPLKKMEFREENLYSAQEVESNLKSSIIDDNEVSLGISLLQNDANFKLKTGKDFQYKSSSKTIIAKKKIYSITIKEEDIIIKDIYCERLKEIAKDFDLSDEGKAEKLEKIFKDTGFYIPLKAYIGGLYSFDCKSMNNNEKKQFLINLKADLDFSSVGVKTDIQRTETFGRSRSFEMMNKLQIGGDTTDKPFKDWVGTIDLKNANIIEYAEIRTLDNFIDRDLRDLLKEPLNLVIKKYEKRREYYYIIKKLKEKNEEYYFYNKTETLRIGMNNRDNKDIVCDSEESFEMKAGLFSGAKKTISKTFNDNVIVGVEIINESGNSKAKFSFKNPLLTDEINIDFASKKYMKYRINIYLIKYPK